VDALDASLGDSLGPMEGDALKDRAAPVSVVMRDRPAAGRTWSRAYSSALTKSVRSMITGRRSASKHQVSEDDAAKKQGEMETQALRRLADAIAQRDKEQILDALASTPALLQRQNEVRALDGAARIDSGGLKRAGGDAWRQDGQVPLHLVCASTPNYQFVDLVTMMTTASGSSVEVADKVESSCARSVVLLLFLMNCSCLE